MLAFLLSNASQFNEFNFSKLTLFFFYTFVGTNLITFIFFPSLTEVTRYTGGAENSKSISYLCIKPLIIVINLSKKTCNNWNTRCVDRNTNKE